MRTGEPLYMTIVSDLKKLIFTGELNPGDMLRSENELAQQYGTSRVTVRKSLQMLENEGFIYPWQGKGYFVAKPEHDVFTIHFSDEERGFDVAFKGIKVIMPTKELCDAMGIAPNQKLIELRRVIRKFGYPVALDMKYIPYDKGMPTLETELHYAVFPDIAAAKSAPFAFHTNMEISAELPDKNVADILQCSLNTPLLVVYRYLADAEGRCMGYGIKYMLQEYGRLGAKSGYEN